ncbi:MAG: DUF2971 domain-containing protein [Chitinophagales bacterium]|nr:DUF2971 domain-containing protein [Chitinophagales bacterium]
MKALETLSPIKEAIYEMWLNEMLQNKPNVLFKYRDSTTNYNLNTLFAKELFFSSARNFNDPFDCSIPFIVNKESIKPEKVFEFLFNQLTKLHPNKNTQEIHDLCFQIQKNNHFEDPNFYKYLSDYHKEEIYQNFGIISLSADEKNFLMWSHYANSHTGYCIGFKSAELVRIANGYLDKVIYQSEIPVIDLAIYKEADLNLFLQKILCVKSKTWSYESEYRFIANCYSNKAIKFESNIIDQIIFGCKMNSKKKQEILEFVNMEYPNCKVFEMKLSETKFELDKIQIS